MAILNKQLFGNIKGTFGNAVFRQRKGNNYISQRPASYSPPNDEAYLLRIEKFKLASRISSTIIANPELKTIWQSVVAKDQNVYNYLIAKVYPFLDNVAIKSSFSIVPTSVVGIKLDTAVWSANQLTVNLLPLTTASGIDINYEKTSAFNAILFLSSPIDTGQAAYEVINISSNRINLNLENPLSFEFSFFTNIQNLITGYQKQSVFASLLTYNEENQVANYSSTVYSES